MNGLWTPQGLFQTQKSQSDSPLRLAHRWSDRHGLQKIPGRMAKTPSRNLAPVKNEAAADRCQLEFSVGFSNMLLMVQKSVEL